jgi:hypothetical protein
VSDHPDPDGTIIRVLESFVCRWPSTAGGGTLVPGLPDDEHARLLKLALSARHTIESGKY